jgi:hypothetical protein
MMTPLLFEEDPVRRKGKVFGFRHALVCIALLFVSSGLCAAALVISPSSTSIGKIIIISPNAADTAVTNGNALRAALEGVTDASSSNPYLIKLGPGYYYIGTTSLVMKPFVDIEGSGENATVIEGQVNGAGGGVVNGASNAELRFLTVVHYGGGSYAKAIYIHDSSPSITSVTVNASGGSTLTTGIEISTTTSGASPRLRHVKVNASLSGSTLTSRGIDINGNSFPSLFDVDIDAWNGTTETAGIYMNGAQPQMNNVSIHVQGGGQGINYGIQSLSSWSEMSNLKIVVLGPSTAYGIYTDTSGILRVNHSDIDGLTYSISNGTTAYIGGTKIWRGVNKRSGSIVCTYCYSENQLLDINCNPL